MKEEFQKIIDELSVNYNVEPLIPNTAIFIFILESPHTQELKYRAPIAGSSGKTMASKLLGESYNEPLGLLIKRNIERGHLDSQLNKIGVMNVSNIPLQRKAYGDEQMIEQYDSFFNLLEKLRTANQKTSFSSKEMNDLQQVLLTRFNEQLNTLIDRKCTIIPCGRFAQKFLQLSTVKGEEWSIINDVPHPSYQSWNREKYKQKIAELTERFEND